MPRSTVVIPCFNDADRLRECLASLVVQSDHDWEAIVVDDGSTDGDVASVVEDAGDQRIRSVRHDNNTGPGAARNTGIRIGTGRYILPLDSDDRLDPQCLGRLASALGAEPAVDFVYPDFVLFGISSGPRRFRDGDVRRLVREQWLPGAGCLYRREAWERVGGYCEDPALRRGNEDWEFYLSVAEHGGLRVRHLSEALYCYRQSTVSTGSRLRYSNYATREFIYRRHRALFDRYGAGGAFRSAGYVWSASGSIAAGEHRRAFLLACRGWLLDPSNFSAVQVVARSLVPMSLVTVVRGFGRYLQRRLPRRS